MRFRPRFSVRTLAIVVALICAYFGAWEATKKWGVRGMTEEIDFGVGSSIPLVIWRREQYNVYHYPLPPEIILTKRHYFWLFGPTYKLPYESKWK